MIRFRTPLIALLAVIPMMAACGSSSSSPSTSAAPAQPTADPANLVLHLPDVGLGYITVAADTKKIPLAQEMKNESPTAKAAERASYQGGYSALFANASKGGVLSEALEYSNESAATTVGNDRMAVKQFTKSLSGHPIAVPSNAPGTNGLLCRRPGVAERARDSCVRVQVATRLGDRRSTRVRSPRHGQAHHRTRQPPGQPHRRHRPLTHRTPGGSVPPGVHLCLGQLPKAVRKSALGVPSPVTSSQPGLVTRLESWLNVRML